MKRKMIALFTIMGLTVSLLAGCGSSGTSETTNQAATKGAGADLFAAPHNKLGQLVEDVPKTWEDLKALEW